MELTKHEKFILEIAITNEIENLEAEIRVINKDIDLYDEDNNIYNVDDLELLSRRETLQERIFEYSDILHRLKKEV